MPGHRRQFSPEFKLEAVRLVAEGGRPLVQMARELAVRPEQLRGRKRKFEAAGAVTPRMRIESAEEENRRLRRELEVVRQERDFLEKAAAFYSIGAPIRGARFKHGPGTSSGADGMIRCSRPCEVTSSRSTPRSIPSFWTWWISLPDGWPVSHSMRH